MTSRSAARARQIPTELESESSGSRPIRSNNRSEPGSVFSERKANSMLRAVDDQDETQRSDPDGRATLSGTSTRRRTGRKRERSRPPTRPEQRIGEILNGTYRIERLIAMGGMGAVFEVVHTRLDQHFAVKFLDPSFSQNSEAYSRFRQEAQIASTISSGSIVQVFDFNTDSFGNPYMVMEYVEGQTLDEYIGQNRRFSKEDILGIFQPLCAVLDDCHDQGIIHRDLKPSNIMVRFAGQDTQIKLLDFGISKIKHHEGDSAMTRDNIVMGTPNYMSPEQALGQNSTVDRRTDVFALGTILYETITGVRAFDSESLPQILHAIVYDPAPTSRQITPQIDQVLQRAMAKDPSARFDSAGDLLYALQTAYRVPKRVKTEDSRKPTWIAGWVASLVVVSVGTYFMFGVQPIATSSSEDEFSNSLAPVRDPATFEEEAELEYSADHSGAPGSLLVDYDGQLYRADSSGLSYWSDPGANPQRQVLPTAARVTALAVAADGSEVLVGQSDGIYSRWKRGARERIEQKNLSKHPIVGLASGSGYLATATPRKVELFSISTGKRLRTFKTRQATIDLIITRGDHPMLLIVRSNELEIVDASKRKSLLIAPLGEGVFRAGTSSEKLDQDPVIWADFHQGDWTIRREYQIVRPSIRQLPRVELVKSYRRDE